MFIIKILLHHLGHSAMNYICFSIMRPIKMSAIVKYLAKLSLWKKSFLSITFVFFSFAKLPSNPLIIRFSWKEGINCSNKRHSILWGKINNLKKWNANINLKSNACTKFNSTKAFFIKSKSTCWMGWWSSGRWWFTVAAGLELEASDGSVLGLGKFLCFDLGSWSRYMGNLSVTFSIWFLSVFTDFLMRRRTTSLNTKVKYSIF